MKLISIWEKNENWVLRGNTRNFKKNYRGFAALIFAKDFRTVGLLNMKMVTKERLMFLIWKG